MLEIEPSRTIKEGVVTKGGFIVDLSSKASFKPLLFDQEIKKVGVRTSLYDGHGGAKVMAKLVVIGDKSTINPPFVTTPSLMVRDGSISSIRHYNSPK